MEELLNKIHFADCIDILRQIPDNSIDLLLQDTPFGVTKNDWDIKPDLPLMWEQWKRVTKKNGAMIFFATQPFASELILSNKSDFRYDLIWYKALGTGFLNSKKMPMRNHESILVFYRKLPTYNPIMTAGKMKEKGRKAKGSTTNYGKFNAVSNTSDQYFPQSVLDFTNGDKNTENDHPTQKPLNLFRYLIKTYSNYGDLVFDGYGGSGTTAIAAETEKRKFIVCENDEPYFKSSVERLRAVQSEISLFPYLD